MDGLGIDFGGRIVEFEKRILADGRATLYRGDSLELLRAGVFGKIGAIVSDPPYGIGFQHSGGSTSPQRMKSLKHGSDTRAIHGDDAPFDPSPWIDAAPVSRPEGITNPCVPLIVLWGANNYMQDLPRNTGTLLAWDKHLGRAADDSFTDCEWAWVGRKVKREVFRWMWKGIATNKSNLDVISTPESERTTGKVFARVHVSQKPVELMRWCIDKVRPLADLPILDPYMGSGSTAIAALSLGHTFVGCEIDPGHFDIACKRVQAYWQRTEAEQAMPLFDAANA